MLGIIGFPQANVGAVIGMALAAQELRNAVTTPPSNVVRFVYDNKRDAESFSKVYNTDSLANRSDFIEHLKGLGFFFGERDACSFVAFMDTNEIYREVV